MTFHDLKLIPSGVLYEVWIGLHCRIRIREQFMLLLEVGVSLAIRI